MNWSVVYSWKSRATKSSFIYPCNTYNFKQRRSEANSDSRAGAVGIKQLIEVNQAFTVVSLQNEQTNSQRQESRQKQPNQAKEEEGCKAAAKRQRR